MKGYDAAYAVYPQGFDVCMFYIGGDTPHPWTDMEVARIQTKFRIPIYTRYPVDQHDGTTDGNEAVAEMERLGIPKGVVMMLDFETGVNPNYVEAFDSAVRSSGRMTVLYGSESTLFQNPKPSGGYALALPGATELHPDTVITQYAEDVAGGQWDESFVSDTLPMWNTHVIANIKEPEMVICVVTPENGEDPGAYLLTGDKYVHIPTPADTQGLMAGGVQVGHISLTFHKLLAGEA